MNRLSRVEAIPLKQDDEWAAAEQRYVRVESRDRLSAPLVSITESELLTATA